MDESTAKILRDRASHRCEYCHLPEAASDLKHVADHIIARQHGGTSGLGNLALCCVRCNQHKGPNLTGIDPVTLGLLPLFNPRLDQWTDHFRYEGPILIGKTPVGRTTVAVLAINTPLRISARRALLEEGIQLS